MSRAKRESVEVCGNVHSSVVYVVETVAVECVPAANFVSQEYRHILSLVFKDGGELEITRIHSAYLQGIHFHVSQHAEGLSEFGVQEGSSVKSAFEAVFSCQKFIHMREVEVGHIEEQGVVAVS